MLTYQIIKVSNIRKFFTDKIKLGRRRIDESRIVDDLIGLMLVVDNGFIGKLKLFGKYDVKYSNIFDAYFTLNEKPNKPYRFLIENDVFNVSALKDITGIMSKNVTIQNKNEELRKKEENNKKMEKKYGSVSEKPTIRLGGGTSSTGDIEHRPFVQQKISSVNELPPVPPPNRKATPTNSQLAQQNPYQYPQKKKTLKKWKRIIGRSEIFLSFN